MIGRLRNPEVAGWLLMAAVTVVAAAFIFWLERGLTYGWDEYVWLEHAGLGGLKSFFHPYGGHLIAFPYFIFRGVLELFGADFTAFAIVQVLGLSLMAALVYVFAKRRIGPILGLAPAIMLLFLGCSWPVLMEPMIGIQFLAALVPGLAAILMLEREDRTGDIAACVLLCLALTGFSEAVPFLLGAVVAVAVSPNRRHRAWVVLIPIVAYGAWRVDAAQVEPSGIIASNIPLLPSYFVDALSVFACSIFGLGQLVGTGPWTLIRLDRYDASFLSEGIVFTIVELLILWAVVWGVRRRGAIPRSFWPPLAILVALLAELGVILVPGRTAAEPRYLYVGVLALLLVAVEMLRGTKTTRATVVVALALTAASVAGNMARFHEGRQTLDYVQKQARADMTVIQLAGKHGEQAFTPNLELPYNVPAALVLNTGPWLEVVDRYGSSADSIPELRSQVEVIRDQADLVATATLHLELAEAPARAAGACRHIGAGPGPTDVVLPRGGAVLEPTRDSAVSLRRWASHLTIPLGSVSAHRAAILRIPPDPSAVPWKVRLDRGGSVAVCPID